MRGLQGASVNQLIKDEKKRVKYIREGKEKVYQYPKDGNGNNLGES